MLRQQSWVVSPKQKNLSPYQFLCRSLDDVRPGLVKQLLQDGGVTVDGRDDNLSRPLRTGNIVAVDWPEELLQRAARKRGSRPLTVIYHDAAVLVVDKPAGLSVIPERRRSRKTVLDFLPDQFAENPETGVRAKVVHRLDKYTSGALLVARSREAKSVISQAFLDRQIHKEYLALIRGEMRKEKIEIDAPIGKDRRHALRMVIDERHGKESFTRVSIKERFNGFTLLSVEPVTGRTHQIRVHLSHLGFPIIGDALYGGRPRLFLSDLKLNYRGKAGWEERPLLDRQALHCNAMEFLSPATGQRQRVEAPLPDDLAVVLKQLRRYRQA